jgi:hypothetical protein
LAELDVEVVAGDGALGFDVVDIWLAAAAVVMR